MIDLALSHEGEPRLSLPFLRLLLRLVSANQNYMDRVLHSSHRDDFIRDMVLRKFYLEKKKKKKESRTLTLS